MQTEPRPAAPRDEPFIWATWLTKLITGEAHCEWALWFRARNTFEKLESGANLEGWTKEHNELVEWRARKLREAGIRPRIEQGFEVIGRTATVKGKADIAYEQNGVTWIEECKTGKRRDSDHVQALVYMWLIELGGNKNTQARVVYKDGIEDVDRGRIDGIRATAARLIKMTTDATPPPRVPSQLECRSCNIGPYYCEDRMASDDEIFKTDEF